MRSLIRPRLCQRAAVGAHFASAHAFDESKISELGRACGIRGGIPAALDSRPARSPPLDAGVLIKHCTSRIRGTEKRRTRHGVVMAMPASGMAAHHASVTSRMKSSITPATTYMVDQATSRIIAASYTDGRGLAGRNPRSTFQG